MTTEMDRRNILYTAKLRGLEEGRKEGRAEGTREALISTAQRMVRQLGYTIEQAAEATGLAPEQFLDS